MSNINQNKSAKKANNKAVTGAQAIMQARMKMYAQIRRFFSERAVQEVETPILSTAGTTDLHIDSLSLRYNGQTHYLHTSPEFFMKRLLAAGFSDCFQIAKVFRDEPVSRKHLPEFSMLEWYRIGYDMHALIKEVAECVQSLHSDWSNLPIEVLSYTEAFQTIHIHPLTITLEALKEKTHALVGYVPELGDCRETWLDFLWVTLIEEKLGDNRLTFITDYPESMAALAKKATNSEGFLVAKRFELYYQGVELANGFDELTDANEQLERFVDDNHQRAQAGKPVIAHDQALIAALDSLPPCAGVAVGIDRLLMLLLAIDNINQVVPFACDDKMNRY